MINLLALLFLIVGTFFLGVAALGVLRFRDPFQRMHASTKAGTLGAGLVLAGSAIAMGAVDATVIAIVTIVFLIATLPVAGHLLGRAAYISGAPLLSRSDALEGVLPRMEAPLEARLDAMLQQDHPDHAPPAESGHAAAADRTAEPAPEDSKAGDPWSTPGYAAVRFPVVGPDAGPLASRALKLAIAREVPAIGIAVLEPTAGDAARIPEASDRIRASLATAVAETRRVIGTGRVPFTLIYEEGDPLSLVPGRDEAARELLLLPTEGWCHHGAQVSGSVEEEHQADMLFELAQRHAGPTLFAGTGKPQEQRCVIVHDGRQRTQKLALWALRTGLWPLRAITLAGTPEPAQAAALAKTAARAGLTFEQRDERDTVAALPLPPAFAGAAAVIVGAPPAELPAAATGAAWQDRLIPGFRGDVLVR